LSFFSHIGIALLVFVKSPEMTDLFMHFCDSSSLQPRSNRNCQLI